MNQHPFLEDKDIADLLGISLQGLRNKISRGQALPPRIKVPGCKKRLWPADQVYNWLHSHVENEQPGIKISIRKINRS